MQEITPPDSVVPVFYDDTPREPVTEPIPPLTEQEALVASILAKIAAGIPLTEDEIAVIGGGP